MIEFIVQKEIEGVIKDVLEIAVDHINTIALPFSLKPVNHSVLKAQITGTIVQGELNVLENVEKLNIITDQAIINAEIKKILVLQDTERLVNRTAVKGDKVKMECHILLRNISHLKTESKRRSNYSLQADDFKSFRLKIKDIFSVIHQGTVVTGIVKQGVVYVGDKLHLFNNNVKCKSYTVGGMRGYSRQFKQANTGMEVALIIEDVAVDEFAKGDILAKLNDSGDGLLPLSIAIRKINAI